MGDESRTQNRRAFLGDAARALALTALAAGSGFGLAGCGGGGSPNDTVRTSGTGRVADVRVTPEPGATFIGRAESFVLEWPDGNPPAEFNVTLHRFLEPRGGQQRETPIQTTIITSLGPSRWSVERRDGFDLDNRGVYYVQLASPGQTTVRFAFIVQDDRSVTVDPETNGFAEDVILVPSAGSVFVDRSRAFRLVWTADAPPPPTFTAFLYRYKEARGDQGFSVAEQEIELEDTSFGSELSWELTRTGNTLLEPNATYYIELRAGSEIARRAFITHE